MSLQDAVGWFAALPLRWKVLAFATVVVLVELGLPALRPEVPRLRALDRLLPGDREGVDGRHPRDRLPASRSGPVGLVMRLFGHDPLDRRLAPEPSFWRAHEPNPLGPERAARHQF